MINFFDCLLPVSRAIKILRTVPVRCSLFTGTVPVRCSLFTGTVPVNNFFLIGIPIIQVATQKIIH